MSPPQTEVAPEIPGDHDDDQRHQPEHRGHAPRPQPARPGAARPSTAVATASTAKIHDAITV